mmetsp:Transcript_77136/g.213820  ORF Transcript_77136/g.213820 Transcript_77136/m.213820 type:complete len:282 (-) Transcript_77136:356-1201(-)
MRCKRTAPQGAKCHTKAASPREETARGGGSRAHTSWGGARCARLPGGAAGRRLVRRGPRPRPHPCVLPRRCTVCGRWCAVDAALGAQRGNGAGACMGRSAARGPWSLRVDNDVVGAGAKPARSRPQSRQAVSRGRPVAACGPPTVVGAGAGSSLLLLLLRGVLRLARRQQAEGADAVPLRHPRLLLQVHLPLLGVVVQDLQEQLLSKGLDVDLSPFELEVRGVQGRSGGLVLRTKQLRQVWALQRLRNCAPLVRIELQRLVQEVVGAGGRVTEHLLERLAR